MIRVTALSLLSNLSHRSPKKKKLCDTNHFFREHVNLPLEYAKIYQFQDWPALQCHVKREQAPNQNANPNPNPSPNPNLLTRDSGPTPNPTPSPSPGPNTSSLAEALTRSLTLATVAQWENNVVGTVSKFGSFLDAGGPCKGVNFTCTG